MIINLQQAEALFQQNSVLLGTENVLPVFRAIELFGTAFGEWIAESTQLQSGSDYNARGACTEERPLIEYLRAPGFFKLVSEYNYRILVRQYKSGEGGRIWERIRKAQRDRLESEKSV